MLNGNWNGDEKREYTFIVSQEKLIMNYTYRTGIREDKENENRRKRKNRYGTLTSYSFS